VAAHLAGGPIGPPGKCPTLNASYLGREWVTFRAQPCSQ